MHKLINDVNPFGQYRKAFGNDMKYNQNGDLRVMKLFAKVNNATDGGSVFRGIQVIE